MDNTTLKKLETGDLDLLKKLKDANNDLLNELGQIKLIELNLEKRIANAKDYQEKLVEKEIFISKSLEEKYGKGTVDLDTGTFIPSS